MAAAGLSPAMRAALLNAHARTLGGLCFVIWHESTRQALVAQGLAAEEDAYIGVRTILTEVGIDTAEKIRNEQENRRTPMALKREEVLIPREEMDRHYAERQGGETAEERAIQAYEAANPGRQVVGSRSVGREFWLVVIPRTGEEE